MAEFVSFFNCSFDSATSTWRWTETGQFTSASAYQYLHNPGIRCSTQKDLRRMKIPMKVKSFIWLMLEGKILTQDVLIYRGCQVPQGCTLCGSNRVETKDHILWNCVYAIRFRFDLMAHFKISFRGGGENIKDVWIKGQVGLQKNQKIRWSTIWAAGVWGLWRERNIRILYGIRRVEHMLVSQTAQKIQLWMVGH